MWKLFKNWIKLLPYIFKNRLDVHTIRPDGWKWNFNKGYQMCELPNGEYEYTLFVNDNQDWILRHIDYGDFKVETRYHLYSVINAIEESGLPNV